MEAVATEIEVQQAEVAANCCDIIAGTVGETAIQLRRIDSPYADQFFSLESRLRSRAQGLRGTGPQSAGRLRLV